MIHRVEVGAVAAAPRFDASRRARHGVAMTTGDSKPAGVLLNHQNKSNDRKGKEHEIEA